MTNKAPTAEERNPNIAMPPIPDEPKVESAPETQAKEVETGLDVLAEEPVAKEEVQEEIQEEKYQQKHFKNLREAKEKAERERDEAIAILKQAYQPQQQVEQEEEPNLAPDDIPEWRHVQAKMQKMEQRLQQYEAVNTQGTIEARVKAQYPDFDKIVSKENIESLRDSYPEIAQTLNSSSDLYAKAISAYKLIKQFGIAQDPSLAVDREKAQRNASKPKPVASVNPQQGGSPISKANAFEGGLTKELQAQLLREMADARKDY